MGVDERTSRAWRRCAIRPVAIAFTAITLLAIGLQYLRTGDANKCEALMTKGQWYHGETWLTPGCATEPYSRSSEINSCFEQLRIVLAGDASIQGIYWTIVEALKHDNVRKGPVEHDLHFSNKHLELDYLWDPYLNGSGLEATLDGYGVGTSHGPALVVIGGGEWHVLHNAVTEFDEAIETWLSRLKAPAGPLPLMSRTLTQGDGPGDLVLFMPVQGPYSDEPDTDFGLDVHRKLNSHLQELSEQGRVNLLSSFTEMTRGRKDEYQENGISVNDGVLRRRRDVILGLRCNAKLAVEHGFPHTRVCCGTWKGPNWVQVMFLISGVGIVPAVVALDRLSPFLTEQTRPVIRALCAFVSVVSLQYLTDRTHILEQATRLPLEMANLYSMLIVIALIGLMSIERSRSPKSTTLGQRPQSQPFLSRDQSDEWKGWMQALIITYHYNMAWSSLWFWEIIRLAVSSYLFLTGFGHTLYFLQKKDYSLKRVAAVIIRTNLLAVTLAYVMRTRWLLYYYMPLSSFWFLVVYATLAIAPSANASGPLLIGKVVISAGLVHAFISTPELAETVVRFFALTCNMSFDAQAFFDYRVRTDQYIVYIGMLAAILYIWIKEVLSQDSIHDSASARFLRASWPWLGASVVIVAALALPLFWHFKDAYLPTGPDWTSAQPYITWVPILAFLVLRNAHSSLRNYHSAAFAWLGRYSGEMYVMQNHLWLAGDQEAVLRTGFWHGDESLARDRWRDMVTLTPLYLIMCCVVGDATAVITRYFLEEAETVPARSTAAADEVELGLLGSEGEGNTQLCDAGGNTTGSSWKRRMLRFRTLSIRSRVLLLLICFWSLNMTYT